MIGENRCIGTEETKRFYVIKLIVLEWSSIAHWLGYLLLDPAAPGSIPNVPQKISQGKNVSVSEVNQWRCLEESGQWLENVDRTHLVLGSGKLVLQKVTLDQVENSSH